MKEIIINKNEDDSKYILVLEDGKLVEKYLKRPDQKRSEGNIYVGKVQNILSGMQAAFVDIGEGKNAFIHLKDILPKKDITKEVEQPQEHTIKTAVKQGDNILVQVKREETSKKGARISTHLSITGKYVVLMPETEIITISQKIENKEEKERLKDLAKENLPKGYGLIIRTVAEGKEKEVIDDINELVRTYKKIITKKLECEKNSIDIMKVYESLNIIERIILDLEDNKLEKIITNDKEIYDSLEEKFEHLKESIKITYSSNVLGEYSLLEKIEEIGNRKIWLKCGGFITIDRTEALIAIDVNSGKYIGKNILEDTFFKVNKEATVEIAKQLRLRDLGGIIIIDYIDMQESSHREEIIKILDEEFKKDRSKTQILEFTKLNLLEVTRKHMFSE